MMADLTLKQRKWLDAYIQTGNATEAARRAGYNGSDETLAVIGFENIRKLNIPIADLMDKMGLTDGMLMGKLADGLEAMSVKTATDHGTISDERAYVDYPTRQGYLDMALKLKGRYPATKVDNSGNLNVNLSFSDLSDAELDKRIAALERGEATPPASED